MTSHTLHEHILHEHILHEHIGKRKVELVELCEKSEEMKVPKSAEEEAPVDPRTSMKEQLKTVQRDLTNPLGKENRVVSQWTKNFTKVADFRFPDLFI